MKKRVGLSLGILVMMIFVLSSFSFGAFYLSKTYNYSSQAILNDTQANTNALYLEVDNSTSPYSNLVGYWSFDADSSTTAYDLSGNNLHGTYTNGAFMNTTCNSGYGNCAGFDGVNDYTSFTATALTTNFTISYWSKLNRYIPTTGLKQMPFGGATTGQGYIWEFNQTRFYIANDGETKLADITTSTRDTNWKHVIVSVSNANVSLYLNGVFQGSQNFTPPFTMTASRIGQPYHVNYAYNGSIDEVMIFNTALNSTQVSEIYNNQSKRFKGNGTAILSNVALNETGNNQVNWTINKTNLLGSKIYGSVAEWDVSRGYNTSINGLISYWTADGNANDLMGLNNGTLTNGALANGTGVYDKSFFFDGVNDGITISPSSSLNITGAMTVAGWVYISQIGEDGPIISKSTGSPLDLTYSLYKAGSGGNKFQFYVSSAGNSWAAYRTSSSSFALNTWYYVVGVYSPSSNLDIYVNGILNNGALTGSIPASLRGNNAGTGIGDNYQGGDPLNGSIDEVMIFNRSLSADEIKELYIKGRANWKDYGEEIEFSGNSAQVQINSSTTNLLPYLRLESPNFYTPYVFNQMSYVLLDSISPEVFFIPPTPENDSGVNENFTINVSAYDSNLNRFVLEYNNTNTTYYVSNASEINLISENNYSLSVEKSPPSPGEIISYRVYAFDRDNNFDVTETRIIKGNSAPSIDSVVYFPTSLNDLDPFQEINFTVNVSDVDGNLVSVVMQVKNASLSWGDVSVINLTSISGTINSSQAVNLVFNFTPEYEQNFSFRVLALDTVESSTYEVNLSVFWDCSWNVSTNSGSYDMGTKGGMLQYLDLGNFTIFNVGDANYSDGCVLKFGRDQIARQWFTGPDASELFSSSGLNFSFDYVISTPINSTSKGIRYLKEGSEVTNVVLVPDENATINVGGYFTSYSSILEEYPFFVVASNVTDTTDGKANVTITMKMIITPGAYLESAIEEPSSSPYYISLAEGTYNFKSYVKNVVDASSNPQNNTAHNVSLEWDLPSEISSLFDLEGSLLEEVVNDTTKRYLTANLTLSSSNLESLTQSNYTLYSYASGYENSSGELEIINHSSGQILNSSIVIQFYCPTYVEGMVTANVCKPTVIETPGSGGSSPGGGGGGGPGGKQEKSEAEFELVIGKQQEFQLPIKNKYPNKLTDLKVTVSGINSEYVSISPEVVKEIPGNSEKNITIKINAPSYFREGNYTLRFKIDGFVESDSTKSPYTENKVVTLFILDISREEASVLLDSSRSMIEEMNNSGLFLRDVSALLKEIESSFSSTAFSRLSEAYSELKILYESAFEGLALREELKAGIETAEKNGVSVIETKKLLYLAEAAFERGAYKEALERFKEAKLTYAVETKGEFSLVHYVKNNPLQALGILVGISLAGYGGSLGTLHQILKRRLKLLKQEQTLLLGLMKVVQRECFELAHMSMEEYESAMSQYETRLSQAVEEEIRAETGLAHLGKLKGKGKALKMERDRLIDLVKKIQEKYLVKGEIETRIYHNMLQSYSKRLVEIEEEMTFLEAKEYLAKKGLRIGR